MSIQSALDLTKEIDEVKEPKSIIKSAKAKLAELKKVFKKTEPQKQIGIAVRLALNGMLVLDGKGPLPHEVAKILDLVVCPENVKNFNYMEGVKPEVFAKVILNIFGGAHTKDPTWNNAGYSLLYYGMVFHQALVRFHNVSKSPMAHIKTIMQMAKQVDPDTNSHPILDMFATGQAHEEIMKEGTILNDAFNKFINFAQLAPETKSSVVFTVENWMLKFIQSEELRPWANSETSDFNFSDILRGAKFGIALPEFKYGDAGLAIQSLMKARLYNEIKDRGNDAIAKGFSRVFLFVDECQRFLDEMDLAILPEARSLELVCNFASQNINSVFEKYGKDGGGKFMASFASILSFKSTPETYAYVQERIGKSKVIERTGGTEVVDFERNAQLQVGTPFFDVTNPHRKMMKSFTFGYMASYFFNNPTNRVVKMEERSGTVMGQSMKYMIMNRHGGLMPSGARINISKEAQFIFNEKAILSLETPFRAIAVFDRGGVTRRDIIATIPYTNDFKKIDTSIKSAQDIINNARNAAAYQQAA